MSVGLSENAASRIPPWKFSRRAGTLLGSMLNHCRSNNNLSIELYGIDASKLK